MVHTVDDYLRSLNGEAKDWMHECVQYIRSQFPEVSEGLSYQVPTYRLGNACIAFSAARGHFTFHSQHEGWMQQLQAQLPRARFAKGTAKIPYDCPEAKPLLFAACHSILHEGQNAPLIG